MGSCKTFFLALAVTWIGSGPTIRAADPGDVAAGRKTEQVVPAIPSVMVDVLDADHRWPVRYRVPRAAVSELMRGKRLVVEESAAEEARYRFASTEAAEEWFAAARPIVLGSTGKNSALQEIDFGTSIDHQTGGVVFDTNSRAWLWTEFYNSADEVKRQIEEVAAGKPTRIACSKFLLFDRQQRIWVIPGRGGSLLGFDLRRHEWTERKNLPPENPPQDSRDRELVPSIIGPAYESRSGVLFVGDRMGVHVFDGKTWQFQKLYKRNVDEDRFFDLYNRPRESLRGANARREIRRFSGPSFSEDSQGRVYVWTQWGHFGEAGTIGFWVFDHGTWKNVDVVERLRAVIPRDPGEVWLVADGGLVAGTISVLKSGRHISDEDACGWCTRPFRI